MPKEEYMQRSSGVRSAVGRRAVGRLLATVLGLATALPPPLLASQDSAVARFASQLAADVEHDAVGGVTAALARDGEVLWSGSFGWADREERRPAKRETIYRTGSISKSVTEVLMAVLARDGVMSLDAPLQELVPEVERLQVQRLQNRPPLEPDETAAGHAGNGAVPTLRQVASHTAGLIREPKLAGAAAGPIGLWKARILASIPTTRYQTPPGVEYSYSNIGFGILGLALERAADQPFMHQVQERIFGPLGMGSSVFVIDERLRPRLATGYANGRDGRVDATQPAREHAGRGYKVPNGGVYSTVDDLAAFAAGVMGRGGVDLLGDAMRSEVLSVQTPEDPDAGYGLGFSVAAVDGRIYAGHGGSVAGYTAYLLFEPATGLTVVLLRNYNRGRTNLGAAARGLLANLREPTPPFGPGTASVPAPAPRRDPSPHWDLVPPRE